MTTMDFGIVGSVRISMLVMMVSLGLEAGQHAGVRPGGQDELLTLHFRDALPGEVFRLRRPWACRYLHW